MTFADLSSSAADTYRGILRHIRARQLKAGDMLPSQPQWRQKLRCGTVAFNDAMKLLEAQGVVHRRKRAGTRLLRRAPREPVTWDIGICTLAASEWDGGIFHAVLAQYLHMDLQKAGCNVHLYRQSGRSRLHHELSEFDGLTEALDADKLDGVLFTSRLMTVERERLHDNGVAECTLMNARTQDQCGRYDLLINDGAMVRDAVDLMAARGCRSVALITSGAPWTPEKPYLEDAFTAALSQYPGLSSISLTTSGSVDGGLKMGARLLAMADRPDGLICTLNDYMTLGITHAIKNDPDYRPVIATPTNLQAPIAFPIPVYRFETDIRDVAQKSIKFLMSQLHSWDGNMPPLSITASLMEPVPSEISALMMAWGARAGIRSVHAGEPRRIKHHKYGRADGPLVTTHSTRRSS